MRSHPQIALGLAVATFAAASPASAADFDGDGHEDLVVGSLFREVEGFGSAGSASALYGSEQPLSTNRSQFITQAAPGMHDEPWYGDNLGWAIATGDFNGDGRDDVAISAPEEVVERHRLAGVVQVLYGAKDGISLSRGRQLSAATAGIKGEPAKELLFGLALAAGDFDGDGRDDLAIGSHREGLQGAGAVDLLYGSRHGITTNRSRHLTNARHGLESVGLNYFGRKLAAGDFNGDRREDLAVAIPFATVGREGNAGAAKVFYGSRDGIQTRVTQTITKDSPGMGGDGAVASEELGSAMTTGDFNGDDRDDLALYAAKDGPKGPVGEVHVVYGSNRRLRTRGSTYLDAQDPRVITDNDHLEQVGFWGLGLGAGDLDANGRDDLIVSSNFTRFGNVFFGSGRGIRLSAQQQILEDDLPGDGVQVGSEFGWAVGAANLNGRGPDELIITELMTGREDEPCTGDGGIHILYPGNARNLRGRGYEFFTPNSPGMAGAGGPGCQAWGWSLGL